MLSGFSSMSLIRNKLVGGCIVICILLNGFVPRFSIEAADYELFSQIIASQSVLLHFLSISSLPEKIVAELFKDQNLPSAQQKKHPAKQGQNSANTSSDFTLVGADARNNLQRCNIGQRTGDFDGTLWGGAPVLRSAIQSAEKSMPGGSSVFLFLVLFFFLLPRSNLSDGGIVTILTGRQGTQLVHSSWVFYLIFNNYDRRPV
jgi:hypothetical protein